MPPGWRALNADTDPWAEEIRLRFFRQAPAWQKLEMASELTRGMIMLTEAGLRERHPQASSEELRRMLADIILGEELALRVYGPHNGLKNGNT